MSFLLIFFMLLGMIPGSAIPAKAGYEDGTECEFCGGYRFDDWLCDCGPHCSENADGDCYEQHHCPECNQAVSDPICDVCKLCDSCDDSDVHCLWCGEHTGDLCDECIMCDDCIKNFGTHCCECGSCLTESGDECPYHGVEWEEPTNHCGSCAEFYACQVCGECFVLDWIDYCDDCQHCSECFEFSEYHCEKCLQHDEDICSICGLCPFCQEDTHCGDCGECIMEVGECPTHPMEDGADNHCEYCAFTCEECGECFFSEGETEYCTKCQKCYACGVNNFEHCAYCLECLPGEICEDCGACIQCAVDEGLHCSICEEHGYDWCEYGGDGSHCLDCSYEFLCEECGECASCLDREFCADCGFCSECCREVAIDEGCDCGDYCIYSVDWDEHYCNECSQFFCVVDVCEDCGLCVECCEGYSECKNGLCVEDPEYDEHFCEDCGKCFCETDYCGFCHSKATYLCGDCCTERSYNNYGCDHGVCTNSWEWREHFCTDCGDCYEECTHIPNKHTHRFPLGENVCIICGAHKLGIPVITEQPKDQTACVSDESDDESVLANNTVTFTVKATGDNLIYKWYIVENGVRTPLEDTKHYYYDIMEYSGTSTNKLTVWIDTESCGTTRQFVCKVTSGKNSMIYVNSTVATLTIDHTYSAFQKDYNGGYTHIHVVIDGKETVLSFPYAYQHYKYCVACSARAEEGFHRYGNWYVGVAPTKDSGGYMYRYCLDCDYQYVKAVDKLPEAHVHKVDHSLGLSYNSKGHWGKCVCGFETYNVEPHEMTDWETVKYATASETGEEKRSCGECDYTETRTVPKVSHKHTYYTWEYIIENGYIDGDTDNLPYEGEYGKTDRRYHYAYCLQPGCDSVLKRSHAFNQKWITYPSDTEDGVINMECGECMYSYSKTAALGRYPVIVTGGRSAIPAARPGAKVKIYRLENYAPGTYLNDHFDAYFTYDTGKTWVSIEVNYHAPDASDDSEYWYFRVPLIPAGVHPDVDSVWVEVEGEIIDCAEDHGDEYMINKYLKLVGEVEATCGHPGYTGDLVWTCCNLMEEQGEVTPQLEHGTLVTKGRTIGNCTERSYSGDKYCSVCDTLVEKGTYGDYSHRVTVIEESVAATCTTTGTTRVFGCGKCGKELIPAKRVPKTDHTWVEVEEVPGNCTTKGKLAHYKCSGCDAVSLDGENRLYNIALLTVPQGHSFGEYVAASTTHHIRVCTRDDSHVEMEEHTFDGNSCTVCGFSRSTVGYAFSGTVKSGGNELTPVTIKLYKDGVPVAQTTEKGCFTEFGIANVLPGKYTVKVIKEGHITGEYDIEIKNQDYFLAATLITIGDATGDGKVNTKDVLLIRKYLGGAVNAEDVELECADVDHDGKITPKDVLKIRKFLGGVLTVLD